jgi:hypothetical protein
MTKLNLTQMVDPRNAKSNLNRGVMNDISLRYGKHDRMACVAKIQSLAAVLCHGDEFKMIQRTHGFDLTKTFTVGTLAGCAADDGSDLKADIERAEANGHSTAPWATPSCSVIASDPTVWCDKMIEDRVNRTLAFGDVVLIEGSLYRIDKVPFNRDQINLTAISIDEFING